MIGLKRGEVELLSHQEAWMQNAEITIKILWEFFGDLAIDIQHVGSTAISSIHAKPIIDIAVGVRKVDEVLDRKEAMKEKGIVFRGQDVEGQLLFVMGDMERDTRTHHIHVVKWGGSAWEHYISFRDYLNAHSDRAIMYDSDKQRLAAQFSKDRKKYTLGKKKIIAQLLNEADQWK